MYQYNIPGPNLSSIGQYGSAGAGTLNYNSLPISKGPADYSTLPIGLPVGGGGNGGGGATYPTGGSAGPQISQQQIMQDMNNSPQGGTGGKDAEIGGGGWFTNGDGTLNLNSISTIGKTLGAFGQVYAGIQQNKIARDALNFQKESYATNLANQLSSYNLALEDRMTARYKQEGRPDEAAGYIAKHRLGDK